MASFLCLKDDRLKLVPLRPPTISNVDDPRSSSSHDEEYTQICLHPCLFPMVLDRIYVVNGNNFIWDSWQERHLKHCQAIVQEISQCELKMKSLRTKSLEWNHNVKLIEEIEDDMFLLDSSVTDKSYMSACSLSENSQMNPTSNISGHSMLPEIPTNILGLMIAPLIRDRHTFDSLAATCKELRHTCMLMDPPPPWPEGLVRLGSGIWYVPFWGRTQENMELPTSSC